MKMKNYIILLITILFVSAKAQEKITIVPKWKDKETKTLIIIDAFSYDEEINTDTLQFTDTTKIIKLQAIKNKNSYNLIWQEKKLARNIIEKKYLNKLYFNIALNEKGEFKELENKKEVYNLFQDMLKEMLNVLKEDKNKKEEYKKLKKKYDNELKSKIKPDTLELLIKDKTSFFLNLYGKTVILNDTVHYTDTIKHNIERRVTTTAKKLNNEQILIIETYKTDKQMPVYSEYEIIYNGLNDDTKDKKYYIKYIYNIKTGWIETIIVQNVFMLTKYLLK